MAGTIVADTLQDGAGNSTAMDNAIYGSAKAWVSFSISGGVCTRIGNYNVSSITYNSTGRYTVNLTNALADANGSANVSGTYNTVAVPQNRYLGAGVATASTITVASDGSLGTASDLTFCYVAVFR